MVICRASAIQTKCQQVAVNISRIHLHPTVFSSAITLPSIIYIKIVANMCVEVFATYICNHTVPLWVPCGTFAMKNCAKYQRQYRNRPLRCSCTCNAPVSLTEALQDNSFADGLLQDQLATDAGYNGSASASEPRSRDSMSPDTASSPSSSSVGVRSPALSNRQPRKKA